VSAARAVQSVYTAHPNCKVRQLSLPRLDIVIVNWNSGAQLCACLRSVAAASRAAHALDRVVVVDNGSTDGSADLPDALGLPLTVIRNEANRGFAAACNRGAAGSGAGYLLFLNPDARLAADALDTAVAFLEDPAHATIGICGVRLVDERGATHRSCTLHPAPRHFVAKMVGLDRLAPRLFPSHVMTEWDHAEDREVDHVMGAVFLVRRSLFERLGGFDERFFVYLEDLDLTLRAKQAGFGTVFLSRASAFHKGGGVSEQVKPARLYYSLHSRMRYGRKHFPPVVAWGLAAGTLLVEPVARAAGAVATGRWGEIGTTVRGFARLWRAALTGRGPVETAGR